MPRQPRPRRAVPPRKPSLWFEVARRAAGTVPGVTEQASAAGPVLRIGRRRLARLAEDGVSLVVPIGEDERALLIAAEPRTFAADRGDQGRPMVRIHLAYVDPGTLARLLAQAAHTLTGADRAP
ncbi:MmcQ/YjbR family DNA-binding protein [Methylobacterium terricola]|uniref:MmcQ/YjbR family DNA-binding protein n=1 Tax=Methylobacterium terricola TaxID=2583531 RepID=A0A5C4LQ15_9HYPH|nr:MmcQ/YjbR family DNA-binding protein [Methylobacterium terricola]TNC15906.1 MmcQ/YjbR family DNA-binding protein [Methylobacterium terricola]